MTKKYILIFDEISTNAASPILAIKLAIIAPKLNFPFIYNGIIAKLPPQPGIAPIKAPING